MTDTAIRPPIRSFVRRQGRLTAAQRRALDTLWSRFGVDHGPAPLDPLQLFGRDAPRVLEIGFGDGESLAAMAAAAPDVDFLGIEVHRPGIGHLLLQAEHLDIDNLRVICADAVETLQRRLPSSSLDRVQIFFPDPWPKQRHHKRRLIQPGLVTLLSDRLKPGGRLHLATDWEDYAYHMLAVLEAEETLCNEAGESRFSPRPAYRPPTKFEQRGQRLGHNIRDLIFKRCPMG